MRKPPCPRYPLGLDLGQSRDHTALTALDLTFPDFGINPWDRSRFEWPCLRLLYAARLPLGTDYIQVPRHVDRVIQEIHRRQPFPGHSKVEIDLYVDSGGPGRPVVDLLRARKLACHVRPLALTGGDRAHRRADGHLSVPRRELLSNLRMIMEAGNLRLSPRLAEFPTLRDELLTASLHGRQREHDDLAVSLSLAVWAVSNEYPDLRKLNPYMPARPEKLAAREKLLGSGKPAV